MMYVRTITLPEVREGMKVAEAVYVVSGAGVNMLIARKDMILDAKVIAILKRQNVKKIQIYSNTPAESHTSPIPTKQISIKTEFPETNMPPKHKTIEPKYALKSVPSPKTVFDDDEREEIVFNITQMEKAILEPGQMLKMTTAYEVLNGFNAALNKLVAAVTADQSSMIHIHDLKSYDEYTYHHSMSVALLSVATGQALGVDNYSLVKLCHCAALHDLGKSEISLEIVRKQGKLTDEEMKTMKNHSQLGAFCLKAKGIGDNDMWNAIMFHHEKVNGKGYPKGLHGAEIPLFSKIISVADVYDALTSFRSYRDPMPPAEALGLICSEIGTSFDYDVVKAFVGRIELYPIGTVVELLDGSLATVVDNAVVQRPIIQLNKTGETIDLSGNENLALSIKRVLKPEKK